jgi:hypothetical protein
MFRPLEAIIRSRLGCPGEEFKFKVASGIGGGRRIEISFFQMYYKGTLVNVVGKVEYNLRLTNLELCI